VSGFGTKLTRQTPAMLYGAKSGKWTDAEHQLFLEAVKIYANKWKKIEHHIGTKTNDQIRSHA
jgi:SHAQKYF class myb-like DNA-binding protein